MLTRNKIPRRKFMFASAAVTALAVPATFPLDHEDATILDLYRESKRLQAEGTAFDRQATLLINERKEKIDWHGYDLTAFMDACEDILPAHKMLFDASRDAFAEAEELERRILDTSTRTPLGMAAQLRIVAAEIKGGSEVELAQPLSRIAAHLEGMAAM